MKITKLLTAALLGSTFLAACSEEDTHFGTNDATLRVSTAIKTESVSRAVFEGTDMGAGQKIGVSIFNIDGSDYNGQATGYKNILYTSESVNGKTTWSTTTPVTLTPTIGKAIAYYPYRPDANIEALPVETASVTDYLYSDWIEGVNSTKLDAHFMMNHALSAIKINFRNESYTGAGTITRVALKSAELGTFAMLNAKTGALTSITGQGTEIATTKAITLNSQTQSVIMTAVPTGKKGNMNLIITMDGKTFDIPVFMTEPFTQGDMYVCNVSAKTGVNPFEVTSVTIKPWNQKNLGEFAAGQETSPVPTAGGKYIVEVKVDGVQPIANTYYSNMYNFTGTIDWGDGTPLESFTSAISPSHEYKANGVYTVTHAGICESLNGGPRGMTKIILIEKALGVTDMTNAFDGAVELKEIAPGCLDQLTEVTSFSNTFTGCIELVKIPQGLFDKCTKVTDFSNTFSGCSALTQIPAGLFDKCPEVSTFSNTFEGCISLTSIPVSIFDNNRKVTDFSYTLNACHSLNCESPYTVIYGQKVHLYERHLYPKYFTAPTIFDFCFDSSNGLTDIADIPIEWGGAKQ